MDFINEVSVEWDIHFTPNMFQYREMSDTEVGDYIEAELAERLGVEECD